MADRKVWDKTYREKHKEEIKAYRKKHGAQLEARRDPIKRKASRKRYYEKNKERWLEYQRQKRASADKRPWWDRVLERIENIVKRNQTRGENG